MSTELLAILITSLLQMIGLVSIAWMIHQQNQRVSPGEAAVFLQGKKLAETIAEMRRTLDAR
jgi:hypothetical protein